MIPATASPSRTLARLPRTLRSLLIFFLLATALHAQTPASAYARGKEALAGKQYAAAAELFAEAAADPNRPPDTLLLQSRALLNADRLADADRTARAYLAGHPRSAPALYLLGAILFRENRPKESLETYTRAAALQTPTAADLRVVALDYVLLELYPDARRWLTRALAMNPRDAETLYDLGRVEMHDGNFAAARQEFEASLALDPDSAKALNNLGLSFEAMNRPADAMASYDRAIAVSGPHPSEQPLLNQGALLITLNRAPEAISPLRRASAIAPTCVRCHEELARALAATGQLPPAIDQLQQAVRIDPANPRLHFQLGQLFRREGLNVEAGQELKRSAALYGTRSSAPAP